PHPHRSKPAQKRRRLAWVGAALFAIPFLAFGALVAFKPAQEQSPQLAQRSVGSAMGRTLATIGTEGSTRTLASNDGATGGGQTVTKSSCDKVFREAFLDDKGNVNSSQIFPFIPDSIADGDCGPAMW